MCPSADRRRRMQALIARIKNPARSSGSRTRDARGLATRWRSVVAVAAVLALAVSLGGGLTPAWGLSASEEASQPAAPTEVTVSEITSSTAEVTWEVADSSDDVVVYDVYVDDEPALTTAETEAEVTELDPNTSYDIQVIAVDESGATSEPTATETITTADAEGAPLGTELLLDPAEPNGTNGWYRTAPLVTLSSIPSTEPASVYYSIDTTETMTLYTGSFEASSGVHTLYYESRSDTDPERPVTTYSTELMVDPSTVPAPTGVTATETAGFVSVNWDAVEPGLSGIDRYVVHRDGLLYGETTGTVMTVTGLEPQTTYEFSVSAVNGAGTESLMSQIATVTTSQSLFASPPSVVLARAVDGDATLLSWQPAAGAVGPASYLIRRSDDGGTTYSQIASVTAEAVFTHVDTGLRSSTEYLYVISTVDDRGEGMPSEPAAASTGPPERPAGVSATSLSGGVSLSWDASTNPGTVGYHVYRSDASLGTETTLTTVPTAFTTFIDTGLTNGRTYWYRVAAVDDSDAAGAASVEVAGSPELVANFEASPHGTISASSQSCSACHRVHSAVGPSLSAFLAAGEAVETTTAMGPERATAANQAACLSCHNGDLGRDMRTPFLSAESKHPVMIDDGEGLLRCGSCHKSHRSDAAEDTALLDVNGAVSGNAVCYGCHGADSGLPAGDLTVFETSVHSSLDSSSAVGVTCGACHETHTSPNESLLTYSSWMNCVRCHDVRGPAESPDVATMLTGSAGYRTTHVATSVDHEANGSRMSCQNCHSAMSLTADAPLVDPDNPSPSGAWTSSDRNAFCLRCHDGTLPTAEQTGTWAEAPLGAGGSASTVDIASAFQVNAHGNGTSVDGPQFLRPGMGYSAGMVLDCETCHGTHGTVNPMNLRADVPKADGSVGNRGALVTEVPGGGYDTRFFCSSCHDFSPENHLTATGGETPIATFPMDCTACHSHVAPEGSTAEMRF